MDAAVEVIPLVKDADRQQVSFSTEQTTGQRFWEFFRLGAEHLLPASNLQQQFLVVGAEVAEPTKNVTAVDWTGASFRGEGLGAPSRYDPASFTSTQCSSAVRAGVAAVLNGLTGIVIWLP